MNLDLRDLRYFRTVAELGHVGRAANRVGRSQPALTKSIDRLESTLGRPLFTRKGRGIELTPLGRVLLEHSRRLLTAAENSFRQLREFTLGQAGHVRIGSGTITAQHLLPQICTLVLKEAPGVSIEVTIGANYLLRNQLKNAQIDLIVGVVQDKDPEFATQALAADVVVAAAGANHPIFRIKKLSLRSLLNYGWVLPIKPVASRQWLDRVFESHGLLPPRAAIETNSISMLVDVIARTELLCYVSRRMLARESASPLREIRFKATTLTRKLGLTYSTSELAPAVQRVVEVLRKKLKWDSTNPQA